MITPCPDCDKLLTRALKAERQRDHAVAAIKQGIENLKDKPRAMIGEGQ